MTPSVTVQVGKSKLELVQGDIAAQDTEAVVNAANSRLAPGAGVAGAIHRAAGPGLAAECRTLNGCATGEAKLTGGHLLRARYVIHTVGPVYGHHEDEATLLRNCYQHSLELASAHHVRTISFPAVSTGIFGYPVVEAARTALSTAVAYLCAHPDLALIRFVLWDAHTFEVHRKVLEEMGLDQSA